MQQIKPDPAASYRRHTPRQAARSAARYDREAKETIAAYQARRTAEAHVIHVRRALRLVELLGVALHRGTIRGRPMTREERMGLTESVKDAWKTLRSLASETVTVLT